MIPNNHALWHAGAGKIMCTSTSNYPRGHHLNLDALMKLERIKSAVNAGLQVYWTHPGYTVQADLGAASGFSIVWALGSPTENRIGLTWSDGIRLNGDPDDFYVDYNALRYVVDDAQAEHTLESTLNNECRFVAFQVGEERVWVAVFSFLDGLIDKADAIELAADLLIEKGVLPDAPKVEPVVVI